MMENDFFLGLIFTNWISENRPFIGPKTGWVEIA
jgi:hypothetical protein